MTLLGASALLDPGVDPAIHEWARLWLTLLWVGVGLFALLSVYVIIFGFFDILEMFRTLRAEATNEGHER